MRFSSTLSSSDAAVQAIDRGYVPLALRPYVRDVLVAALEARVGRAEAGARVREELSTRIRAAVVAEAGPVTPTHLAARARITQRRIALRLEQHGLRRPPGLRTILNILGDLVALGSFGIETTSECRQSEPSIDEGG